MDVIERRPVRLLAACSCFLIVAVIATIWIVRPGQGRGSRVTQTIGTDEQPQSPSTGETTPEGSGGTEICARCGAKREMSGRSYSQRRYDVSQTKEQRWAERRIGACTEHAWEPVGCWTSQTTDAFVISCTMIPEEHRLWRALANLGGEPSDLLARRFAQLPRDRQVELWRQATTAGSNGRRDKEIARSVAVAAGWSDLATKW